MQPWSNLRLRLNSLSHRGVDREAGPPFSIWNVNPKASPMSSLPHFPNSETKERELLLRILAAITFLIFFQGYMVAPMIPRLAIALGVSEQRIGLLVPAYLSLLFGFALHFGFTEGLAIFAGVQAVAGLAAIRMFRSE